MAVAAMNAKLHISSQSEENFLTTQTLAAEISENKHDFMWCQFFLCGKSSYAKERFGFGNLAA